MWIAGTILIALVTGIYHRINKRKADSIVDICGQRPLVEGKRAKDWRDCRNRLVNSEIADVNKELKTEEKEEKENKDYIKKVYIIGGIILASSIILAIILKLRKK